MNDKLKHFITFTALLITITAQCQITKTVPFDKKWHIGCGAIAGVWGTFMGNSIDLSAEESALVGVAAGLIVGIGKETLDIAPLIVGQKNVQWDTMDIAASTLGGVIGAGLSYAALKIFKRPPVIYAEVNKGFEVGIIKQF